MKTVRSFANEEEEAEVYLRGLQQVYKLNRKEAAAYMYYVWGSGVRAARRRAGGLMGQTQPRTQASARVLLSGRGSCFAQLRPSSQP